MSKKNLKLIMELIFIFILPIAFMFISVKSEVVNTYDENGNLLSSEKIFDFSEDSILRDYNNNLHYKNILYLNQNLSGLFNSDIWNSFNANKTLTDDYAILSFNGNLDIQFYTYKNLDLTHKYLILMKVSSTNNSIVACRYGINNFKSFNLNANEITYIYNIGYPTEINTEINYYIYFTQNDPTTEFYFYWGELIDLTEMFGDGYEPTNLNDLYFNYTTYYQNNYYEELFVFSNDIISSNYVVNYTWYIKLFNELYNDLQINNNIVLKLITTYIILWVIMFLVWHLLYRFVDFMVHLFDRKE